MRRIFDVAFAIIVILLFFPIWVILAIILRLTGEGKIFYFQPRIGLGGRTFKIVKFTTMLEDSPNLGTGNITIKNDPRVLPLGRFLRITKINEIPQVINLIKGEMTLVGPRPLTPKHFALYPQHIQRIIVSVLPGLTGVGSIVFRNEERIISDCGSDYVEFVKNKIAPYKGELELWYIRNRNWLLDLKILFLTCWALIFHDSILYKKLLKGVPERDDDWYVRDQATDLGSHVPVSDKPTNHHARIGAEGKNSSPLPLYVVTVNYKSEYRLRLLIQSLSPLHFIEKLIVVDHSESEGLTNVSAPFPLDVVTQPNKGYGAGLNRGLKQVDNADAVVLVCNPDVELMTPETVSDAVRYLGENPRVACLAPTLLNSESGSIFSGRRFYTFKSIIASRLGPIRKNPGQFRRHHFYMDENLHNIFPIDWASGSALFLRGSLFPYPLSFDERFFLYFEDVDLCTQICIHGLFTVHYPYVVFKHHEQRKSARDMRYFSMHLSSLVKYVWKYRGFPQWTDFRKDLRSALTD